jgi:Anti-sigma factor NepR
MTYPDKGVASPPTARQRPDSHIRDKHVPLPSVHEAVQERLRAGYAEILSEPIPQRFLDLLNQLDRREPEEGA